MRFVQYGNPGSKTVIFLHGGGLSTWNFRDEAEILQGRFHILIPILDGHHGSDQKFTSIEENAARIIRYIDSRFQGQVFLIAGLSLGGQVLVEMLSQRNNICEFAIIESTGIAYKCYGHVGQACLFPMLSPCEKALVRKASMQSAAHKGFPVRRLLSRQLPD